MARSLLAFAVASLPLLLCAQTPNDAAAAAQVQDLQDFGAWLKDYRAGAFRVVKDGKLDDAALQKVDERMAKLAHWNTLAVGKLLFEAASVDPRPPNAKNGSELIDFHREVQPWRIQALACKHLRAMTADGLLGWLLGMLDAKNLRSKDGAAEQRNVAAVLRVLAGHPSLEAKLALQRACLALPPELRVRAVMALAEQPALDDVPTLLDLLRDAEPNVRIGAADGLAAAMQPLVDESQDKHPEGALLQTRDQVIARLAEVLQRDQVWQVRSAAAFGLARLKCKPVVPAIIEGLKVELQRKKDPWAMDLRLHRLLEGLTGKTITPGDVRPWEEFWQKEGPGFTVARAGTPIAQQSTPSKYGKFFNLQVESDRVLFVLDFSGSMAEPVTLDTRVTGVPAGQPTTKAQLVVAELKKLIMSLPDGTLLNFVIFSDDVRVWREDHGRPALVKLDDAARDDLLGTFLDSLRPNGATNLYGALAKVLEFGGRGLYDKYYGTGFDTLYVITDGAPSAGEVIDKDEIRRRVREANRLRRFAINCITFGDKNDTDFLAPLATENGGRHIHVD
jgi:hypothetical protein